MTTRQTNPSAPLTTEPAAPLARVVERNIDALLQRQKQAEKQTTFQDRLADSVTAFVGSMRFVYVHLLVVIFWVVVNAGWVRAIHIPRFDPTFVILATAASVESIFLSTFILISQNRMQTAADKRSDLDLQVSLLSEHEVTRLITLVSAMARKMGVEESRNPGNWHGTSPRKNCWMCLRRWGREKTGISDKSQWQTFCGCTDAGKTNVNL